MIAASAKWVYHESELGRWDPESWRGGRWEYGGTWHRSDRLAGEIAVGLTLKAQEWGATEIALVTMIDHEGWVKLWWRAPSPV